MEARNIEHFPILSSHHLKSLVSQVHAHISVGLLSLCEIQFNACLSVFVLHMCNECMRTSQKVTTNEEM